MFEKVNKYHDIKYFKKLTRIMKLKQSRKKCKVFKKSMKYCKNALSIFAAYGARYLRSVINLTMLYMIHTFFL